MKILLSITIFSLLLSNFSWAKKSSFLVLSEAIPSLNDEILYDNIQEDMKNSSLDLNTLKLVKENAKLEEMIGDAQIANRYANKACDSNNAIDPPDKKKKKTVIKGGWKIIGAVEVNLREDKDSYERLENSLSSFQYDRMYREIEGVTSKEDLERILLNHTSEMSDDEYMGYLSEMTSRLPYNNAKAGFSQKEQETDSLYSMVQSNDIGGICGDIHFATVLMGEATRSQDYEFYTASYVMGSAQHVYSFAVNKEDPSKAYVINYGRADRVDNLNGVDSILTSGQGRFDNIGANLRIYKNTGTDQDGKAEHVATLPTPIGRYLNRIHLEDNQRNNVLNQNQGTLTEVNFENSKTVIKEKGEKVKTIDVAKGVKLVHGSINNTNTENSDVFTLMVYNKREKNLDEEGRVKDPKRVASESNLSLSGSLIDQASSLGPENDQKIYYMRFNYFNRYYKTLIKTDKFDLEATAGLNISADFVTGDNIASGDGNLETEVGLRSKVDINKSNSLSLFGNVTNSIGLKEEREVFNFSKIPSNIKMTANLYNIKAKWDKKFDRNQASLSAGYTKTQVGGVKDANLSYQINTKQSGLKHIISVNYMLPDQGLNLLQTREQFGVGYGLKSKTIEAGGVINYSVDSGTPFFGGKVKINLQKKK